jgi:hypothetical protein
LEIKPAHTALLRRHNTTMTESALRRSGRERKQVESVYSDAQKEVAAEKKKKRAASRGSSR